jgi:hypothetical protein
MKRDSCFSKCSYEACTAHSSSSIIQNQNGYISLIFWRIAKDDRQTFMTTVSISLKIGRTSIEIQSRSYLNASRKCDFYIALTKSFFAWCFFAFACKIVKLMGEPEHSYYCMLVCSFENTLDQVCGRCTVESCLNPLWQIVSPLTVPLW